MLSITAKRKEKSNMSHEMKENMFKRSIDHHTQAYLSFIPMNMENQLLITDEPIELET
jgi:hypothetical protein